jgi:preprotein translocase subunit SecG
LCVLDKNQGCALQLDVRAVATFTRSIAMLDVVMLALAFVFFALSIAYVYACDQL